MKKVLFIAYYFPPAGGAGVQRPTKFVKYLPALGWLPVVLTCRESSPSLWAPPDESMKSEVPANVPVYRADTLPPSPNGRWRERLCRLGGLTTPFAKSWRSAIVKEGSRAFAEHRPDLIFITMSPFEGAAAAAALARQMKVPWVADLRDPWALDVVQVYMSGLHRELEKRRMSRILRDASVIIMNTPESAKVLRQQLPELRYQPVVCIPNGFDASDFTNLARNPDPAQFTIVHTGFLHTLSGLEWRQKEFINRILGRVMPGVDLLTRSHYYLLKALAQWLKTDPNLTRHVRVILAGNPTEEDRKIVRDSAVKHLVTSTGYLPHEESLKLMNDADLLFLPMHNLPRGHRARIVPSKTYEYMASGRPILAAVPEGDARDYVMQAGTGLVCSPDDVEGMMRILQSQYKAWQNRKGTCSWNQSFVERFERRRLTGQLASVFDSFSVEKTDVSKSMNAERVKAVL